jgi:hypothetical protein
VRDQITAGVDWIVAWVGGLPGRIASSVIGAFSGLWTAFKSAVNSIIRGWNGLSLTLGGGSYDPLGDFGPTVTVPSFTISTPDIPEMHTGGVVPGPIGSESLWKLEAGETVRTRAQEAALGFPSHITVMIGAHAFEAVLVAHDNQVADRARAGVR